MAIFALFILALFLLAAVAVYGVHFDRLALKEAELSGVSFSLRPRAKIAIDEITINSNGANASVNPRELMRQVRLGFFALFAIEELEIKQLSTDYGYVSILYKDEKFRISHDLGIAELNLGWIQGSGISYVIKELSIDEYNLTARGGGYFEPIGERFFLELSYASKYIDGSLSATSELGKANVKVGKNSFRIAEITGDFSGDLALDLVAKNGHFIGQADVLGIAGKVRIDSNTTLLSVEVTNAKSSSLEALSKVIPIPGEVQKWIYGYAKADYYEAERFKLDIDLQERMPIFESMYLNAHAFGVDIEFDDELPSASSDNVFVTIENSAIKISANEAFYEGQSAAVLTVITDLYTYGDQTLYLGIETEAIFDKHLQKLVGVYGANVDLLQIDGKTRTIISIVLPILAVENTKVNVMTHAENGKILLNGVPLDFNEIDLLVNNSLVRLNTVSLAIDGISSANFSGTIDAERNQIALEADLHGVALLKNVAIVADDLSFVIDGSWDKTSGKILIDDLDTNITVDENGTQVSISDLMKLKLYMPILQFLKTGGGAYRMHRVGNETKSDFHIVSDDPLFFDTLNPITDIYGQVTTAPNHITAELMDRKITVENRDNFTSIKVKNLEIDMYGLKNFADKLRNSISATDNSSADDRNTSTFVYGERSAIRYKDHRFLADTFSLYRDGDHHDFLMSYGNSTASVIKNGSDITINANRLNSDWVQALSGVRMSGGIWNMSALGRVESEDIYAIIHIEDTTIERAKLFTNVIALINTIPSLVQLRNPGFDAKGFKIINGVIEIYYHNGKIYINSLRLIGINTDIIAQGTIDITNDIVDVYASVQTAKAASGLISRIPIVGYLLLGSDHKIENILHITGSTENPKVETNLVKGTIIYPFGVIKRTLTLPVKMFEEPAPSQ